MKSYKVYLTRSSEASYAIAHGYGSDMAAHANGVIAVSCGSADGKEIVPAHYHNSNYFYCAVTFDGNMDDSKAEKYELTVC